MDVLERFREVNRTFPHTPEITEHKARGGKVFGWLCTYVPEEIIHAAGALPVRVTGYNHEVELEDGNAYMYVSNCSFSRSCLQFALRGEYDFLDGIVAGSTCDGARRLFDLWRHYLKIPFSHILTVPRKFTPEAHALYYDQVRQFKAHFEEHLGLTISDDALLKSIKLYNDSRALLQRLYDLRKLDRPPITGAQTLEVLNASLRMPRETFNAWLTELLAELEKSRDGHSYRARLMLVGSVLTNTDFVKAIEDQGGLVVTDELCTSTRYWSDPVVVRDGEAPLAAIARRYLDNFPCARMFPSQERFDRILKLAHDFRVDGVISQIIRYCVPYAHDVPMLSDRLKKNDIPILSLDIEYGTAGSGQVQTRVQAFLEMIEARKR